ncbi:STE3-domain-containing protein [Aureobasidium namibiae CBS 147.97]|uniref:STE3-domain-containing protein n=1 Tax=Aureobasidium namibiae CBS 147.97 TaxID=1043004 RepID=A0A074WMG3_9PEZI|nr:STE3-domain-containing protein [Aureobasidium namibiae CBS 147.97]KEQ70962.1 STE3-domain-containing protein [Aureobasidium namibiae CBS 147.97]
MATQDENYLIIEDHIIPQGVILAVLAPFVFILNFPPLIWHLRNRNTAAVSMVFWVMLMNFLSVLNVIIWPYIDMRDMYDGQGLCDVEIKLLGARTAGLNAAVLCLLRALAAVLNVDKNLLGPSKAQKRWNTAVEMVWCVGLPLLTMILQYIVQLNRFALLGVSGCQPMSLMSWTGFVLIFLPPMIANAIALYYAILVIYRLNKYRSSFNSILASSNTTRSRFFCLFATASTLILGITPVQIYIIVTQYPRQSYPFNFRKLHDPATWNTSVVLPSTVLYDRWINLACGFLIFFFFGMGRDAKGMYKEWLVKMGLGRLFPVLSLDSHGSSQRGGLSTDNSKRLLWRKSSWIATTER